jgi:hypothetical protein
MALIVSVREQKAVIGVKIEDIRHKIDLVENDISSYKQKLS